MLYDPNPSMADVLTMVAALLLPVLVGLVTKASTSSGVKAVLLAALSAVAAVVDVVVRTDGPVHWWPLVLTGVQIFVVAVATHFGLWKPTTVSRRAQAVLIHD